MTDAVAHEEVTASEIFPDIWRKFPGHANFVDFTRGCMRLTHTRQHNHMSHVSWQKSMKMILVDA